MKVDRRYPVAAAILIAIAVSSAVPIVIDGWWLNFGTPDRFALAAS
jgi:hypothetical protein